MVEPPVNECLAVRTWPFELSLGADFSNAGLAEFVSGVRVLLSMGFLPNQSLFLFIKRWQRIQTLPLAQLKLSWDTVLKSQAVFSPCGIQLWFSLPELWGHASGRLDRRLHPGGSSSDETFHSRVERLSGTGCGCSPLEESLASQ